MQRHTFAMEMKNVEGFRSAIGEIWIELKKILKENGVRNFSIWTVEKLVFGYYETENELHYTDEVKEAVAKWEEKYGNNFEWISEPFKEMRLMYQDFGIVRESKDLIRHRVFITKLKPGNEEEYKARHDKLVEARNGEITKGPDSNFSIWYGGGYIFGYNEIDTTMEKVETEEDRQNAIAWETRMLEIMDWRTDDVDWISGEHHKHIQLFASFQ